MNNEFQFSIYLDTRRAKKDGTYPVKLQLYTPHPKRQKLYSTKFNFTKEDFSKHYETKYKRIPSDVKDVRNKLNALLTRANETAEELHPFSIEAFERRMFVSKSQIEKVKFHYDEVIQSLREQDRISTANSYELSLKSLGSFLKTHRKDIEGLRFNDITPDWLNRYEKHMIDNGKSISTVGIYLRPLRAVFNRAIENNDLSNVVSPFSKGRYRIPTSKRSKKALSRDELKRLFQAKPENEHQQRAKDFWFFSFNCNGMNMKDIALLKYSDFDRDKFEFQREKVKFTSKSQLEKITVYLTPFIHDIIKKYGTTEKPENYVFDIVSPSDTPEERHRKIKLFIRNVNGHLKKLCKANDLPEAISSNWARHSFATHSIRKGATMEFMRETLGHKNIKTTQIYFNGFEDETKKEFAQNIMNFD